MSMDFVFVCPVSNKVFSSPDFRITGNPGVVVDTDGNRCLEAQVVLDSACPFCGEKRVPCQRAILPV